MVDVIRKNLIASGNTINAPDGFVLNFDATLRIAYSFDAEAVSHPVESGPDRTDHVQPRGFRLTLEAVNSNTPIGLKDDDFPIPNNDFESFSALAEQLELGEIVTVVDGVQSWADMAFVGLEAERSASRGQSLAPRMVFERVIFVDSPNGLDPNRGRQPNVVLGPGTLNSNATSTLSGFLGG